MIKNLLFFIQFVILIACSDRTCYFLYRECHIVKSKKEPNIEMNVETRKKKKKKKSKGWKIFRIVLLVVLIALLIGAGVFAYRMQKNGGGVSGFLATAVGHDEETRKNLPPLYCLVLGKSDEMELTDSIMVCSYDPKNQKASLLSIPRDTFIGDSEANADTFDKINAVYQISPEKALKEVNELTGLDIQYYVAIDSKAITEVVDAIGGVWFDVLIKMWYRDYTQNLFINLDAGYQLINGNKTEQLLRFRHNQDGSTYPAWYGEGDYGRMRTQREFIKATIEQTMKVENIFKITELIDIVNRNVDTNLDFNVLKDYVPYAVEFNTDNLYSEDVPGASKKMNGLWFFKPDEEETKEVVERLFGEEEEVAEEGNTISGNTTNTQEGTTSTEEDKAITIEVLNGSGNTKALKEVTEALEELGYQVTKSGNTSSTSKTIIINRTNKSTTIEDAIQKAIEAGTASSGENNANVDFTIIIGKDYK